MIIMNKKTKLWQDKNMRWKILIMKKKEQMTWVNMMAYLII